jgi:molybdenum cofactor cytidylyltransferase
MRLSHALRIVPGQSVAFVGAGGKTSAIQVLISEVQDQSPVIATTSTRLGLTQNNIAKDHLILTNPEKIEDIRTILRANTSVLVTGDQVPGEPKWQGLNPEVLRRLREISLGVGAVLLIEADGARMKSIKAPARHEPVIPEWVDTVVTMSGLDAIGKPFTPEYCHRAETAKTVLGIEGDGRIEPAHVSGLLRSPLGGIKDIPKQSSVRAFLRQRVGADDPAEAKRISFEVLSSDRIQSVSIGTLEPANPVSEVVSRIAGVVLAAGSSTRLEGTKQLLPFKGKPIVKHVVEAALAGGLDPIIVVVGEGEVGIREALRDLPVSIVRNPEPDLGQGSSLQVGVGEIDPTIEAAVFLLADMPLISSELIESLISRYQLNLSPIIVPFSEGKRGNPVLFDRITFEPLARIEGDQGGRALFSQFEIDMVEWDDSIHFDIDTPEDLEELRGLE